MPNTSLRAALLVSTALTVASAASAAFAQAPAAPAPAAAAPAAAPPSNANRIEEVVVTATRQTSTVNKVALSVSAVTQKSLDQQGIRSVQDLSSQVPGFTFRTSGNDNNPQLTIRGVGGNAINGTSGSAPTTGVYIDDIAFQKRNANGLETGSGSPTPLLYDLDRIEVLRGPQGTLYGGSSEGGTLRFITPTPSLTTYSGSMRLGASTMQGGGAGDEEGIALGGPIVQDKLGFRVSAFRTDRPGWVNAYSEYDGHQTASQVNKGNDYSLHGTVLWQVNPDFKATVSVFNQMNYDQDSSLVRTNSPAVNVPLTTLNNCSFPGATVASLAASGHVGCTTTGVNRVAYSFPATVFGGYTVPAQTWFGNRNGTANGQYLTPTNIQYVPSPRRTAFTTPSITLDYNWSDKLNFKSITADTSDQTSGWTFGGGGGMRTSVLPFQSIGCPGGVSGGVNIIPSTAGGSNCTIMPQYLQLAAGGQTMYQGQQGLQQPGPANVFGYYLFNNRRNQVTQEFRISTIDPSWRLQFVVGGFISHSHNHVNVGSNWNENSIAQQLHGVDEAYFAGGVPGAPTLETPGNNMVDVSTRNIDIVEDEQSVFGEFNFLVTSKFKLTAGVRATNYNQTFNQTYGGDVAGAPSGFIGASSTGQTYTDPATGTVYPLETNPNSSKAFPTNYAACPTNVATGAKNATQYALAGCPYQYTNVQLHENPVTPKIGGSYQLTTSDLIYATYSEGQRPGGVNPPAPPVQCVTDLAKLGLSQVPSTYVHDTVKSTEVGGKFRLFDGQAQLNASAFHIDWDNVQFVVPMPTCSFSYVANAATASSDGAEVQITARSHGFTFNGNLGYDNARYTATVKSSSGAVLANKGDNLGIPDWTGNIGVQYDTRVMEFPTYARMDFAYTGKYMRNTSAGTTSYTIYTTPNFINGNETHIFNGRVGAYYKDLEVALYVKNIFNSNEWLNLSQTPGNLYAAGTTVQPRVIGFQTNYRF